MERKEFSYSIWLLPEGDIKKRLAKIVRDLSKEYNSPVFEPHVSLLGGFGGEEKYLTSKAYELSKLLMPFDLNLTHIGYLDEFFRSLFIYIEKTPAFLEAQKTAGRVFGFSNELGTLPHLSLIYADLDQEIKENIIRDIGKDFNVSFKASQIYLYFNNERDKKWARISEFPLKYTD